MLLTNSLKIHFAAILLCGLHAACAQAMPQSEAVDRPTQRWFPLPHGDGSDLNEQAQWLQQLSDLISSNSRTGSGDSPLTKLSEQQLQEMEKALDNLQKQIGEDKLPSLESIPQAWIDQALSDPVVRKQAEQLLEQYARDRKLPPAGTPLTSDGVPFPRRQPSDKAPNQKSKDRKSVV